MANGEGTKEKPWVLKTPPGSSEFQAYRDESLNPPALVVTVGKTELRYQLRCLTDLQEMLKALGLAAVEHNPKKQQDAGQIRIAPCRIHS